MKHEASSNGKWSDASNSHEHVGFSPLSPKSPDYEGEEDDVEEDDTSELMDRRCLNFYFIIYLVRCSVSVLMP